MNSPSQENKTINIIIADDEKFIRHSSVRILQSVADELGIRLNVIEAEDGIECLFIVYKCIAQGIKISMVFSDENMNFIKGSRSSELLWEILQMKNMSCIPFYLVTAYDNSMIKKCKTESISQVLSKPLSKAVAKNIIRDCLIKI